LRALEGDDVQSMQQQVEVGLRGLENDYLGSSGSRGYGRVKLQDLKWTPAEL
jgi:CRISPR-associated protein Csm3